MKRKIGSILTGIGLGVLIGIWLNFIYSFPNSQLIYIGGSIFLFSILSYFHPKKIEIIAYAISIYVFLQMAWDYSVLDRGVIRMTLFYSALSLLIINTFSGHYNITPAIKILKKAIGIK